MDRREFIQGSFAAFLSGHMLASCARLPVPPANNGSAFIFLHSPDHSSRMRILDLNSFAFSEIRIPLQAPHTSQRIYGNEEEIIVFDFMGKAVRVNSRTKEVTTAPGEDSRFLGHGTQTRDGAIWCTEIMNTGNVLVRARSSADMELIKSPGSSFPGGHHVARLSGSDILVSSDYDHSKKLTTLYFFDCKKNSLTRSVLPANLIVSHILPVSATEVVCITNYAVDTGKTKSPGVKSSYAQSTESIIATVKGGDRNYELDFDAPAPLIHGNLNGEMKIFWDEKNKDLFRFGFGVYSYKKSPDHFITGHTNSNKVIIWNKHEVEEIIDVPSPAGVIQTPDGRSLIILSNGILKIYSLKSKRFDRDIRYDGFITSISSYA